MARLQPSARVEANVLGVLPRLVRRYFKRGRRLVRSQPSDAEMHRFRIRTKRLRYIIELYADLYPTPLRGALLVLEGIQRILGKCQDQRMVVEYFERRLIDVRTPQRQTEYLRVLHRARMRQNVFRNAFFRRWESLERVEYQRRLIAGIARAKTMGK